MVVHNTFFKIAKPLNIEGTNDQVHKVFPQDHGSVNRSHLYNFINKFIKDEAYRNQYVVKGRTR